MLSNEGDAEMSCLKGLEKMKKSYCAGFLKMSAFFIFKIKLEMVTVDSNKNLVLSTCEETDEKEENCFDEFKKMIPTKHKAAKIGLLHAKWISAGCLGKFNPKLEIDEVK